MTHCDILPLIADSMPFDIMIDCKFLAFYKSILSSETCLNKPIANNAMDEQSSIIGHHNDYNDYDNSFLVCKYLAFYKSILSSCNIILLSPKTLSIV